MAVAVVVIYRDVAMNEGLAVSALRPEADIWAGLQRVRLPSTTEVSPSCFSHLGRRQRPPVYQSARQE